MQLSTKYTAMLKCGGLTFDPGFDLDPDAFYVIYSYVYRSHVLMIWIACNKTWTHQCVKIYRAEHWYLNLPRQCLYSPCILTPRDCTNMAAQDRRYTTIFKYIYIYCDELFTFHINWIIGVYYYHKTSSINCTKSQHLNVSFLLLQWSLPNPLKPGAKLRMKM